MKVIFMNREEVNVIGFNGKGLAQFAKELDMEKDKFIKVFIKVLQLLKIKYSLVSRSGKIDGFELLFIGPYTGKIDFEPYRDEKG